MHERVRTLRRYNLHIVDVAKCNDHGFPELAPVDCEPSGIVGFNYATSTSDSGKLGKCCHFFLDDTQFERVWNNPEVYVGVLMGFDCVMTPDFSVFSDMPEPMQRWNVYRQRVIGRYWQDCGLTVVPTLTWGDVGTYGFVFEGLPHGGTVAVSTVGALSSPEARLMWLSGMREAMERLSPSRVLVHGRDPDYDFSGVDVIMYGHDSIMRINKNVGQMDTEVD